MKKLFYLALPLLLSACGSSDSETNVAPIFGANNFITETEVAISDKINALDSNGDTLSFALIQAPRNGSVTVTSSGNFTYTPAAEFTGSDNFVVTISDGQLSINGSVNIDVRVANISFLSYSRQAFNQSASAAPLRVNGRNFIQDATNTADFADLLADN